MANIWKKWLTNSGRVRVVFALLYLFTTLGIPLSHTFQPFDKDVHHQHLEYSSCFLNSDEHIEVQNSIAFNQNDITETTKPNSQYCPTCLFLLTSKAFRSCSNISLYSTQTFVRTYVLLQLSFIKQLEWFCSAPLRAPPSITS